MGVQQPWEVDPPSPSQGQASGSGKHVGRGEGGTRGGATNALPHYTGTAMAIRDTSSEAATGTGETKGMESVGTADEPRRPRRS